jgi:hypothetical protein
MFHHTSPQLPPQNNTGPIAPDSGLGRYSLPNMLGRLFHRDTNHAGPYGGSFFDGGASAGNSGTSGSAMGGYNGQYGGQMPGQGTFGSGYGSGNLFGNNPYNVDAFGQPTDPTQAIERKIVRPTD